MIAQARAAPAPGPAFAAIRVPVAVAVPLLALARALHEPDRPVRWVDPADLHVTLWFIGPLGSGDRPAVTARLAVSARAARPITCRVAGVGTFGRGPRRATWVGLAEPGAGRVAALAASLWWGPFSPHVTVARGASPGFASMLAAAMVSRSAGTPRLAWRAATIELLQRQPGHRPAYETVAVFPLGRPSGPRRPPGDRGRGPAPIAPWGADGQPGAAHCL